MPAYHPQENNLPFLKKKWSTEEISEESTWSASILQVAKTLMMLYTALSSKTETYKSECTLLMSAIMCALIQHLTWKLEIDVQLFT